MQRHIVRTLLAAAAATGAALVTVGFAPAAGAATPSTHTSGYPITYTTSQAGYTTSGRWFRFVGTTVKVPPTASVSHYAMIQLGGPDAGPVYLGIKPGGGANTIGWSVGVRPFGMGGGTFSIAPNVGDMVRISLYYNQAKGGIEATAADLTTKQTQMIPIAEGVGALFTGAKVACVLDNPVGPPASNYRLWQFLDTSITTYTSVHGTLLGKWSTGELVDTTNGHASGEVVMSPSFLFNNGAAFGAWLRTYLR